MSRNPQKGQKNTYFSSFYWYFMHLPRNTCTDYTDHLKVSKNSQKWHFSTKNANFGNFKKKPSKIEHFLTSFLPPWPNDPPDWVEKGFSLLNAVQEGQKVTIFSDFVKKWRISMIFHWFYWFLSLLSLLSLT